MRGTHNSETHTLGRKEVVQKMPRSDFQIAMGETTHLNNPVEPSFNRFRSFGKKISIRKIIGHHIDVRYFLDF